MGWKPPLSPKQLRFLQACHRKPGGTIYNLISGPRKSTKTTAALHAVAEHLFDVQGARFACVSPTIGSADDSGFWTELCDVVIPQWIQGGCLQWVTKPRQKGVTKKLFFEVRNRHGGISRCHLDSLQYEKDAEERFKNKVYSGIYVSELSKFKQRETFDTWRQSLRGQQWQEWQLLFIGDTNPAEEGKESWIWKLWWEERLRESDDQAFKQWQGKLGLMEFTVADNVFKDHAWHMEQAAMYAWSDDLLRRYYHGEWVMATKNSVFYEVFRPVAHVVGEPETPVNTDPEIILPDPNCSELITGWDLGSTNHSFHIIYKRFGERMAKNGTVRQVSVFDFIDEVLDVGGSMRADDDEAAGSIDDFVDACIEKIDFWEKWLGREVFWRNWSDRSAFEMRGGLGNVYHHMIVRNASNGKLILQASDRGPGAMRQRVDLWKRLMFENRIFICRSRCPGLISSCQGLPKGKSGAAVNQKSHFKHAFDSASYPVTSECYDEVLQDRQDQNIGKSKSGLVSVPY